MRDELANATSAGGAPAWAKAQLLEAGPEELIEIDGKVIESSDAAAIMGLDPHRSALDLWREKVGVGIKPALKNEEGDAIATCWGTLLEPLVASVYSRRTGHKLRRVDTVLTHPRYPWMLASVRWQVLGVPAVQYLHCLNGARDDGSTWEKGVPGNVRVDVMHLLAVTGHKAVDLALLAGGRELKIFRVERDEAFIGHLEAAEARFWRCVERNSPPIYRLPFLRATG
ncbi:MULTISPECIES: YqaJ viral recombinase family protein [unclassified Polaromonas]|uniref:YqaJ viral recombinase family nuclease n=1 Tax=unclassified Polaromonas TaxID=2638319 RepID=UPI000F097BE4|nr:MULTISPECIES: YqaJ viral recombinase family protein [unclassified Polaromonas]AYQ26565.1 hypothetical protein DT070_00035 [Polaromonas sp. SP1]QGJ18586.1 hypothetical protein F7R28_09400 [Polaromonas sp. Pch-P]